MLVTAVAGSCASTMRISAPSRCVAMMCCSSAAGSLAMAERPLAMNSPWLLWLPKMWSCRLQRQRRADRRPLLPERQMGRSLVDIGDVGIAALGLERAEHGLEFPHDHHVAQDVGHRCGAARRQFLAEGPGIGVERNAREGQFSGALERLRIDGDGFRHGRSLLKQLRVTYTQMSRESARGRPMPGARRVPCRRVMARRRETAADPMLMSAKTAVMGDSMGSAMPTATLENWRQHPYSVWGFTHVDSLVPIVPIPTAPPPAPLRQGKPLDLARLAIVWAGSRRSAEAALEETYTDGFLVLKDGEVVAERLINQTADRPPHRLLGQQVDHRRPRRHSGPAGQARSRSARVALRARGRGLRLCRRDGAPRAGHGREHPLRRGLPRPRG